MSTTPTKPTELIQALDELCRTPATPVRADTAIPPTRSQFVVDNCLATHIARSKESFAFVPGHDAWRTYGILRSAKEAWQHDKLPVLAVCAFSKSPLPFQRETGIQADTADQFLSDLKFAHRMTPTLGADPAYIIRHYHSPNDKYDNVVLPANANLIVYEPHALSPTQLSTLFEHVANVRGKIILCDDRSDLAYFHPELNKAIEISISKAVPARLRHLVEPSKAHEEKPGTDHGNPVTAENTSEPIHDVTQSHSKEISTGEQVRTLGSYLIYHANSERPTDAPSDYVLVAKVETDDIYRSLANSRSDASWTENPGVVAFTHNPRATRPGDLICHNGEMKQLNAEDVAKINPMQPPIDHTQKERPAHDNTETSEPDRPRRKLKP